MQSLSFYFVVLFVIAPLYLIPPFSGAYVVYSLWYRPFNKSSTLKLCLFFWSLLEVVFSVYYRLHANRIATMIPKPHAIEPDVLRTAFKRIVQAGMGSLPKSSELEPLVNQIVLEKEQSAKELESVPPLNNSLYSVGLLRFDDPRAVDHREYMRTWFRKRPWAEIHTHEMRQWLYWSIFNAAMPAEDSIPAENRRLIEESLELIQQRSGSSLKDGSNPKCKPLLLTIDPSNILPRPLLLYAVIWVINKILQCILTRFYGFEYRKHGLFEYIIRKPLISHSEQQRPLVFIHGLGMGLVQYQSSFRLLSAELPSRYIMIPLQPQISQDIFHPRYLMPLSPKESVKHLFEVIQSFGWDECGIDLLSHSNGTFFHAWMLKQHSNIIKRSCLIDPVSLCTWEGDLCYNFFYEACLTGAQMLVRYFVCTELGVANVLQRHFDWLSNSLWFEDIPNALDPDKTMILLGGRDIITNMERVYRYLRSHGLTKSVWYDPEGRHGAALVPGGKGFDVVLRWLRAEPLQ